MLYIQLITLRWQKDVRDPVHAAARKAVRFRLLPQEMPEEDAVLIHSVMLRQNQAGIACTGETVRTYGAEILSAEPLRKPPYPARLQITEADGAYRVAYCGKESDGLYSEKMRILPGGYGRIVYNQRGAYDYTGIWYYDLTVCNFVCAPYCEYRPKLFFRKEPDSLFEDLRYLRYC
ncbi:MAG: hypothetical protein IKH27_02565 [Oscillospiraceae bacterium]|nr:hypothetical protein [Oscillospiraceae bacterium]